MDATHIFSTCEVRDRPSDAQDTVKTSRRQSHCGRGIRQQLPTGFIRRRHLVEQFAIGLGVGARTMAVEAIGLHLARSGDAVGDLRTALRRGWEGQVRGGDARHFDVEIDAVQQRTGYACLIIRGAARRAAAGQGGISEVAATAWVHRRDELHASRERDVSISAGDADIAGLERLTKRIEDGALELRKLV